MSIVKIEREHINSIMDKLQVPSIILAGIMALIFIIWGCMELDGIITKKYTRYEVIHPQPNVSCQVVRLLENVAVSCWKEYTDGFPVPIINGGDHRLK